MADNNHVLQLTAAQLVGICQDVRDVWSMVNAVDETTQQRGDGT